MAADENDCGRKLRTKERKKYVDQEIDEDDIDGKRSYSLEEMLLTDRFDCEMIQEMTGPEFNMEWIQKNGLKRPILFTDKTGLGLRVPSQNFKISDVKQCVGSRRVLDVMDVSTQKALEMTMKEWVKYFENPERDRLLNVISLEFCHTRLDNYVESPTLVRQIDWVNRAWPRHLKECQTEATNLIQRMKYPKVQKYCLMSVADCYTDWHIDFGGTSVWYHILHGEKIFWLAPPTTKNLDTYVEWTLSAKQGDSFLGDSLEQCQRVNLKAGYTFIIPSGWIHAVYTPVDSLVFGGNFLHSFNIDSQLLVSRIEEKTYVPPKFRYPFFVELMWYVLDRYLACLTGHTYLNPFDESEDAFGDADMIHVDEDSRPPSRNPDSRPPSRTMDDLGDPTKVKPESGEEAPKLSKSVTIELTRIDAALKKAQGEEETASTPGKRPPRKAASDVSDGGLKKWVHLTAMELKGLQQIVDHLTGILQLPVGKRGVPKEMFDAEAVLREIKQVLEDHKNDNQELAVSGDPVIGWPESAKKKHQKLKLGYKTYKPTKGPKGKDSSSIVRRRRTRCKQCEACTRGECGECTFCKDMKKFGGPGKMKQTCISRQCMAPVLPCSSVCLLCNKEGQVNGSDDNEDISLCLMECGICWEITHPSCIYSKFENIDNEGNVNEDLPNSWECPKCCNDGKKGQLKPRVKPGNSLKKVKSEEWRSADSEGSQDETADEEMELARSPVEGKRVVSKEGDTFRVSGKEKESGKLSRKSSTASLGDVKVKSEPWSGRSSPMSSHDEWHHRKRNSAGGVTTPTPSPMKDSKKVLKKERNSAPNSPSHQQTDDISRSSRKRPTSSVSNSSSKNGGGNMNGNKEGNHSIHATPTTVVKRPKREGYGGDGVWVADADAAMLGTSQESNLEPYVAQGGVKHSKLSPSSSKDDFFSGDCGGNADTHSFSSSSLLYSTSSYSPLSQPLSDCSMYNLDGSASSSLLPSDSNPNFNIANLKQEYSSGATSSSQEYSYNSGLRDGSTSSDIKPFSAFAEYHNTSPEKLRWGTDYTPKVKVKNYVVRPPPPPHIPDVVFMNNDIPHPLTRPLWTLIFSYLSQNDLARLSSVCRTFDCWVLDPTLWPELNLSRISIKQSHLKGIVLRQPRSLKLASSVISHSQLLWLMARLPGLKHLDLSNLSWASICALCFADCPLLQSLHLNWATGIRHLCFRELASPPINLKPGQKNISRLCCLERLSLTGTDITDLSLDTLATHLPKLVALDLTCCMRVTDRGIRALVQLGAPCLLQDIRLVKCVQLTERCLDSLATCRELRFLALTDIPAISQEACVRFSRNYKHRTLRAHAHGIISL